MSFNLNKLWWEPHSDFKKCFGLQPQLAVMAEGQKCPLCDNLATAAAVILSEVVAATKSFTHGLPSLDVNPRYPIVTILSLRHLSSSHKCAEYRLVIHRVPCSVLLRLPGFTSVAFALSWPLSDPRHLLPLRLPRNILSFTCARRHSTGATA